MHNDIRKPAKRILSLAALASVAAAVTPPPALAQEDQAGLEDVIVTAQRREERLQDIPIAVTAFTSEDLERSAATGIQDVVSKAPGVTLTQFNIGEPQLYVRGVGTSSDSAGSDPSIGVSIDEVSIGRAGASALAFLDVNRVEVLRGPQGTLYGRNASGGALNIYTNRPRYENSGEIAFHAGSFDTYGAEGVFNTQIGENAAARFAARYSTNDGYAESLPTGASLEGGTQWGGRAQALVDMSHWSFLAGLDYSEDDMDGHARIPVPSSATNPSLVTLINSIRTGMDVRESFSAPDNFQTRTNWGATLRAEREGSAFDFVSLTSYRENEYKWRDNLGGLPFPSWPLSVVDSAAETSSQFSQEFRIMSPETASFSWVVGVYYINEQVERGERFVVSTALPIAPPSFGGDVAFNQDATNTSWAAFGQATLPFAEIWELTAGLRWSHDERDVFQQAIDHDSAGTPPPAIPLGPGGAPYAVSASETFEEPSWRLALSVEPMDGVRLYASYDRGYKAGAFVSTAQSAAQAIRPVDSELLDNYAIGAKTMLFNGRMRLNAEAFLLDYQDLQVYELLGLTLITSNADAEVSGVEIETAWAVTSNITLGGSYTHLDASFVSDAISGSGTLPYEGNALPRSPETQYNAFADVEWNALGGDMAARLQYQWTDEFYFDPSSSPEVLEEGYGLWNAFASWESPNGLRLSAYGKNLGDEEYRVHIIKNVGVGFSVFGPPQEFGVSISQRF